MSDQASNIRVTINGRETMVPAGATVLDGAAQLGIEIPTLCHHADLSPVGSCRLCIVEIDGRPGQHPACVEPVSDGMRVFTETDTLIAARRFLLEMMLAETSVDPTAATDAPDGDFLKWLRRYEVQRPPQSPPRRRHTIDADPNPFIRVDLNQCILCTRCVRACEEVQGRFVWGVAGRGESTRIVAGLDQSLLEARCESCGACVAYCPTDALADRMSLGVGKPDRLVRTTCGYCGVGCQADLNVKEGRVVGVTSAPSAPVNGMSLCVKGRYGYDFVEHPDRLTRPRVRQYLLDGVSVDRRPVDRGPWVDVEWSQAIDIVAKNLIGIKEQLGPDAIGFLSSAKCTNEENYLVQKMARQLIGTNNVDHCARLCHSSTVAGLAMALGSGAMTNSMDDVAAQARAILVIGSNTTEQHPVFGAMLRQAVLHRGAKLVVADPRKIDLTELATIHLQQRPGSDVALINGLMHLAIKNNWHDREFIERRCEGFEDVRETVARYTPDLVAEITGVSPAQLTAAAELLCSCRPMAVIWAMGITQHIGGVANVLALANLQMLLGNLGMPGGGVNPLRGQNNVQGACDMGALPNVFPGYQSVTDADVQTKFAEAWALDSSSAAVTDEPLQASDSCPAQPGLTVTELVEGCRTGDVAGLFILGEDPAMTEPDVNHVKSCLQEAPLIVLQEIFPSETARYADVLLPGGSFAEKFGTFTNTERRIQPIRPAVEPPGAARPDWQTLAALGQRLMEQQGLSPSGPWSAWRYSAAEEILAEIAALTPSYAGVSWARVDQGERLQWPVLGKDHAGTPILHVAAFTRGLGKFHAVDYIPPDELPDDEFPFLLTTGRVLYHWHGGELSRRARGLAAVYPEPLVEISPADALRQGIESDDPVRVTSRRGELMARAAITDRVPTGVLFGSFHFPGSGNVNNLTNSAVDPVAKIPEYKVCAAALSRQE